MINLDIKIMATPKRKEQAQKLCKKLNLSFENIIYDDRPNGGMPRYTAEKAWLSPFEETTTHRMVIQDDVEICDDFLSAVFNCLTFQPEQVWTFFSTNTDKRKSYFRKIPYSKISGQCLVMPKCKVLECWDWINSQENLNQLQDDDACIMQWLYAYNYFAYTTIPNLCQNSKNSSIGNDFPPISPSFCKDAAIKKNWDDKNIYFLL